MLTKQTVPGLRLRASSSAALTAQSALAALVVPLSTLTLSALTDTGDAFGKLAEGTAASAGVADLVGELNRRPMSRAMSWLTRDERGSEASLHRRVSASFVEFRRVSDSEAATAAAWRRAVRLLGF